MKAYRVSGGITPLILTSVPDEGEKSGSHHTCFTLGGKELLVSVEQKTRCALHTAERFGEEKKFCCLFRDSNGNCSYFQPVA
jgi:hypothetical protein